MTIRIGQGFDFHPLVEGRKLILGGVEIPYERGLGGHSDADVAAHALANAILGALGEGDLGRHFPDSDPRYKGADSIMLLREVWKLAERSRLSGSATPMSRSSHRSRSWRLIWIGCALTLRTLSTPMRSS